MKTIRMGVFETNSSSTHCVTIMRKADYDKFDAGDICFDFEAGQPVEWNAFYEKFVDYLARLEYKGDMPESDMFCNAVEEASYGDYDVLNDINEELPDKFYEFLRYANIFDSDAGDRAIRKVDMNGEPFVVVSIYREE